MRTKNSIKNICYGLIGQTLSILISFFARIIFLRYLNEQYLGINGLFMNIINVLSLAELGVGPAIIFSLYDPLAKKDNEKVKSLMMLYKKVYIIIGSIIGVLGILITPFIGYFTKNINGVDNIHLIYVLFVINSSISYFYSYKRSLLIADQKKFIATIYRYTFFILLNILQSLILVFTKNYILFLILQITCTFLENLFVAKATDKLFPFINENEYKKIDNYTKNTIIKNVKAMMMHKIGGIVVGSTDNIIISKFIGIDYVGLYSNYLLIINALNIVTGVMFDALTASVGNLSALETEDKVEEIFNVINFLGTWIFSFISITLFIMINPFIELWIGSKYLFKINIVFVLVINFFMTGMRKSVLTFRDALGLYWYDRYKAIFEALINLILSIILARKFGIIGVFTGTIISTLTTCFWIEPYILYKYGFRKNVKKYFMTYTKSLIITIIIGIITYKLTKNIIGNIFFVFVIKLLLCLTIPNLIIITIYKNTKEFKYVFNIIRNIKFIKLL
ncbi:membrane protein involved in the export of O-antigen and teichoic acid [Clostridium perfringens]|uniref:Membrane protein involved in the export of O-antigen and teichoic acid n=1 Tax=Clostridium perfringens TaxID=1502 RepID=A0A2X3C8Y6_CLOPF|nr:hypothetical protein [Clostridium perfringens]SQC08424.1 membrane protein involved in the export of O-antigen and teichoic acid [Clostridium perfringens]